MPPLIRSSLLVVACVAWLAASGQKVEAQAPTYVGTFALTNGATKGCMTNHSSGGGSGLPVTNPWAADPSQKWAFLLLPNGYYAIFNVQTSDFLTGNNVSISGSVGEFPWTATSYQMWYLYPLGGQFYALVNVGNGLMLTDPSAGGQNVTPAATTPWTDKLNQWWYLYFLYK